MMILQREMLTDPARNQLEQLIEAHDPMGKLLAWARRQQREQAVVNERSEVQGSGQDVYDDCSDCDSRVKTPVITNHLECNADRCTKNSKSKHSHGMHHKSRRHDIRLPAVGSVITRDYFGSEIAVRVLGQAVIEKLQVIANRRATEPDYHQIQTACDILTSDASNQGKIKAISLVVDQITYDPIKKSIRISIKEVPNMVATCAVKSIARASI